MNSIIEAQIELNLQQIVEKQKCIDSSYYFYINYIMVNGEKVTTHLTEKAFNKSVLISRMRGKRIFKGNSLIR